MKHIDSQVISRTQAEMFHALQSKNALSDFLEMAYDATELPLTLCDTSFCVLAAYPPLDDEKNIETIDGRQYIKFSVTQKMEAKQQIKRMMELPYSSVSSDPDFPHDILFLSVRINRAVVAFLFSPGQPEGFSPEALRLIEYLSQVLSIEMQKNDVFASETGIKYEYFLIELLEGRLKNNQFAESRLRQLKRQVFPYYFLVQFRFDDVTSKHPSDAYYFEQIITIFPEALVARVRGVTCMLLPRNTITPMTERETSTLQRFLDFNKMHAGFSYRFTTLVRAGFAAEQAAAALDHPKSDQRICYYEQSYLNHLFSLVGDADRLQALIHPDIHLLHLYDEVNRTQYLFTLHTYLREDRNAARAAAVLFIHKSTFFFRMGKIAELLGEDILRNSARLFDYELSFHLLSYLKADPKELEDRVEKQ